PMGAAQGTKSAAMAGRRRNVHAARAAMVDYEIDLGRHLLDRIAEIPGIKVHGITARDRFHKRVPTFSVTLAGRKPADIAGKLAAENLFVWEGNFYALEVVDRLKLGEGGLLRIGLCHYNT